MISQEALSDFQENIHDIIKDNLRRFQGYKNLRYFLELFIPTITNDMINNVNDTYNIEEYLEYFKSDEFISILTSFNFQVFEEFEDIKNLSELKDYLNDLKMFMYVETVKSNHSSWSKHLYHKNKFLSKDLNHAYNYVIDEFESNMNDDNEDFYEYLNSEVFEVIEITETTESTKTKEIQEPQEYEPSQGCKCGDICRC